MTKLLLIPAVLTLSLAVSPMAKADLITWGPVEDTTALAQVSTNGSLVAALNLWGGVSSPVTVNGITFAPFVPVEWGSGGATLMSLSTTGDADFDQVLTTARTPFGTASSNPTGFGAIQLDGLGALQLGQSYEIQVWYCDQRSGNTRDRVMTLSSATGAVTTVGGLATNLGSVNQGDLSGGLEADPNNINGATDTIFGQFCIGTFTRTSSDSLWLLVEGSHPNLGVNLRPHVNAIQIREVAPPTLGTNYCTAVANSTGSTGVTSASGSIVAAANSLTLTASSLPPNQFGIFVVSRLQGFVPNAGGTSNGNLCLSGVLGRFSSAGQILSSGSAGTFSLAVNTTQIPQGGTFAPILAGETWNFQSWHRDGVGLGSNFTNGVEVTFQ